MQISPDRILAENLIATVRLKGAFAETERDAALMRRTMWFCGLSSAICVLMILHHSLDLPALGYAWAFILSLCT